MDPILLVKEVLWQLPAVDIVNIHGIRIEAHIIETTLNYVSLYIVYKLLLAFIIHSFHSTYVCPYEVKNLSNEWEHDIMTFKHAHIHTNTNTHKSIFKKLSIQPSWPTKMLWVS